MLYFLLRPAPRVPPPSGARSEGEGHGLSARGAYLDAP
jgi:hypothetical protein